MRDTRYGARLQGGSRRRKCEACKAFFVPKRGTRRQFFCSDRCRDADRRERNFRRFGTARRGRPDVPRAGQNSPLVSTTCKGTFGGRAYSIDGPPEVIETEIIAGQVWRPVTSPDGVTCQVRRVRPTNNPIAGVISRWEPTWSPVSSQIDAPLPEFLRRPFPANSEDAS
jgi:hypothetical protein